MKLKGLLALSLCIMQALTINAQKQLYIPNEWMWQRSDTLLYKEVDTENKYTWSKTRSKESENFILYWDKYYTTDPGKLSSSNFYYVNTDDLLKKAEAFYAMNVGKLAFCDEAKSKVSKYKMMILMNHTTTWTCYGGGYDFTIGALWLNPSTCKPVGHSVAHEVGHSFQYMCYSDLGGHAGFHDAIGTGSTFWEQTAQWQANQSYPELKWDQSWSRFSQAHNYAMTHEWIRYQSYWWHYYLTEKYGIDFIGKIWRHQMPKAADANEVFMDLMGYDANQLYKEYFDYAMKMATIDLDVARDEAGTYIGTYKYDCIPLGGTKYQVAYSSCPQSTGFNVIPLHVPAAGTEITTAFTSLKKATKIAEGDPVQYLGDDKIMTLPNKIYYNCYSNSKYNSQRAFRLGYVALLKDGTRQYISEDSLYCSNGGTNDITEYVTATVPENTKRLFLVVVPAPKTYQQHLWDENISNDDQWPYTVEFTGTNMSGIPIISDDLPISDATITYDVYFPKSNAYTSAYVKVEGEVAAAIGTAFQMNPTELGSKMVSWTSAGPKAGQIMFYAVNANGNISNSASSANGYGHWFDASGNKCAYASGYLFSEFDASLLAFGVGQYPNKLTSGKDYTIRQALKYNNGEKTAQVTFIFNIHITSGKSGVELTSVEQSEIVTGVENINVEKPADNTIYSLDGRIIKDINSLQHGVYIKNGKKYMK